MSNRGKDFTGQKIGMLTVIKRLDKRDNHRNILWLCKCDCGNETIVPTSRFACAPEVKISCGCQRTKLEDLTGKRFGRWTVVSKAGPTNDWRTRWNCVCDEIYGAVHQFPVDAIKKKLQAKLAESTETDMALDSTEFGWA